MIFQIHSSESEYLLVSLVLDNFNDGFRLSNLFTNLSAGSKLASPLDKVIWYFLAKHSFLHLDLCISPIGPFRPLYLKSRILAIPKIKFGLQGGLSSPTEIWFIENYIY